MRGSTKIGSLSKDRIVIQQIQHNEADHLLDSSTRYMESLYPAESNHLVDVEELLQPRNHFLGAFIEQGTPFELFEARRDLGFWTGLQRYLPVWDEMIDEFNARVAG
ncbi:MAG: hypothetical protein ACO3LJ_04255 [Ilumatobacteraceae bacterium]